MSMSFTTSAWQIVFEALKPEPDSDNLVRLAAEKLDEKELFDICRDHGILLIVNNALQGVHHDIFSANGLKRWRTAVATYTLNGLSMHRELQRLLPCFAAADIPVVPFKGPTLSERLYGDPALRIFCDLDLLVPPEQVRATVDLLINEGYLPTFEPDVVRQWLQPKSQHFHCTLQHTSGRWFIEIHWAVFPAWRRALPPTPAINEWLPLGEGNTIESLLYLCIHGAKHWWIQLKWVVDVDRCVRSVQNLDWKVLLDKARERGCVRVVLLGLFLARQVCCLDLFESVEAELQKDPKVAILAQRVARFWPRPMLREPSLFWKFRYLLSCRERLSDKVGMIINYPITRSLPFFK